MADPKIYEADLEKDFSYDDRNANRGTPRGRGMLEKSISKLGAGRSLVADRNGKIVAGNKTREALAGAQMKRAIVVETDGTMPVIVKRTDWDLDDRKGPAREYAYADNRIAEADLEWDADVLREDLEFGVDLSLSFDESALQEILDLDHAEISDAEAIAPPENPIAKTGDVWILGDHRLVCGDSTGPDVVRAAMDGNKACCVFTDPPYGVAIAAKNKLLNAANGGRSCELVVDDDLSPEELRERLLPAFVNVREIAMADDCTLFICAPQRGELGMMMMMMMADAGLKPRHVLIWKKNQPTFSMGRLDYDYQHEPILLTWGKRHKRPMLGAHKTSIWEVDKPRESKSHPTMKPVELYVNAYLNNSDRGDHVFEPYSGSGTAFLAAEQTGRICHGIEISPAFVDVAVNRWETLTGKKAVRL